MPEFNSRKPTKSLPILSPYQYHLKHYKDGCGSEDCPGSTICFARGQVPADIVFIGEAPGESENVVGLPFYGPAGDLLDHIIDRAFSTFDTKPNVLFTNVVGCIPREVDGGKAAKPSHEQKQACKPRLQEILMVADNKDPRKIGGETYLKKKGTLKAIVAVGKEAANHLDQKYHHSVKLHRAIPIFEIIHPSAILQGNIIHKSQSIDRSTVTLYNMWAKILDPDDNTLTTS